VTYRGVHYRYRPGTSVAWAVTAMAAALLFAFVVAGIVW
jgi:hypothetical protein